MFTVNVMLRTTPQPFVMYFKDQEAASRCYEAIKSRDATANEVRDEFGQFICVDPAIVAGVFMTDPAQLGEVQVEMSLIQARAQASAQMRAQNDPTMRVASMAGGASRMQM